METASEWDGVGRAPGMDLMFRLTEALCGLCCLEDQAGRSYFAGMLSAELDRHIDLRGTKLREDVVALLRAAFSVREGERVLIDVVRVFEGAPAAAAFENCWAPAGHPPTRCPARSITTTWTPPARFCAPYRAFSPPARCATCSPATSTSTCRPASHRSSSSRTPRS
ncbi:hypothetical protein SHKM778_26620 [Streptomyces sp. KM77-8]|uniref:Effector-associated domain-containing protein n=1 Tax=Streptomyces haneummycinicus TaxID=3074435 RepID=A0AAT9HFK7_9ACTN